MYIFKNLNEASIQLSKELLEKGVARKTRGFDCIELNKPVMIEIKNPLDRYITIPQRKQSKTLPFGESLALLSGVNDIRLYSDYVPDMLKYSDDGVTQRAGYGPRIRNFLGITTDYKVMYPDDYDLKGDHGVRKTNDQLEYVVKILQKDPQTRQAVISITDPAVDQLDDKGSLIETKDIPCCRLLQFMIVDGKLDCTAYFRSNDLLFGFQQVNMFNNTFIQECLAMILKVPVGRYFHIANNLHYYEDKTELVKLMASKEPENFPSLDWEGYDEEFSFEEFDDNLKKLFLYRKDVSKDTPHKQISFKSKFFDDWAKVFYRFHSKDTSVNFTNPYINRMFNRPKLAPGQEYVKVLQDGVWVLYNVHKPVAYMAKCNKDGKNSEYLGRVDKYGYLNR